MSAGQGADASAGFFDDDFTSSLQAAWPTKSHSLFTAANSDHTSAFVDWWPAAMGRQLGFQRAAESLAQVMLDAHHSDRDTLVFPWLMCWRHYVELQLKVLLPMCEGLLGLPEPPMQKRNHHRILDLWRELRGLIEQLHPDEDKTDIENVERVMKEWAKIDPDSMSTRYPMTKGRANMANLKPFNIVAVHEAMSGVAAFFGGVESQLDYEIDMRREIAEAYEHESYY